MVVDEDVEFAKKVGEALRSSYEGSVVYFASDGAEALSKMKNVVPHVLVTNLELQKISGTDLVRSIMKDKEFQNVSVIALSDVPDRETFADDVTRGRLKFLSKETDSVSLFDAVAKALQNSTITNSEFIVRKLNIGDLLFREGDPADKAFLVKKGRLRAFHAADGRKTTLGSIGPGEFVGEMAHINGEPRSASVEVVEECELVEIPLGTLDLLIFSKPSWTKALLKTLCKRLTEANKKSS